MRRAKQTNKKKSPDNNEHSPDWFRCITHRLSPHCLFSTLPGVPAVQKVCEQKFSPRRKFEGGKNRAAGSLCECVPTRSAATGLSRRVTVFFFPPKTDRVKGHMEMIHFGVYWRTLWVIACRRRTVSQSHGANLVNMVFTAAQLYTEIYWTTRLRRSIHLPVSRAT